MTPTIPLPAPGESRGFSIRTADGEIEGFLVRTEAAVVAYRNRCPHTGAPLNWLPDRFLTPEGDLVQCAMHGALFRIPDGFCIFGPCAGASLEPLAVEVVGECARVALP